MTYKISIIGAGSAQFSLALIKDICLTPRLAGSTVSFMDIDPQRLATAYTLCRRYAAELGIALVLEKTLDRRESLRGADFVIDTALVGGHQRLLDGWRIAINLGYNWGGSFHIMYDEPFWLNYYQFKLFESITEDMLELCPQAWHLLVSNPMVAAVTHLTRKYPRARLIGLCHGFSEVYRVAQMLGLEDRERLTFEAPGVNHFVWLTRMYYEGRDAFPLLDRWIAEELPRYVERGEKPPLSAKSADLYQRFGALPLGDTAEATGAAWPVWYHSDEATEKRWREDPGNDFWWAYPGHCADQAAEMARIAADPAARLLDRYPPQHTGEVMIPIVEAVACDIPRVIVGNVANRGGLVPGIPEDFEVEIATLVSRRGVQGIQSLGLPPALLAHILRDRVAPVNMELAAYEAGSRELLLQLVMMDPWTRSEAQARRLIDEIFALPYHEELRGHYR